MEKITNKRGAINLLGVFLIVLLALGVFGYFSLRQSAVQTEVLKTTCEIEPYIDNATFNKYSRGTAVAVTYSYMVDGSEDSATTLTTGSGGTSFNVGDKIKILSSASGVLDQVDEFEITKCGSNKFTNYVSNADGATMDILDKDLTAVSDGVTAANAVNITGGTNAVNYVVRFEGVIDEDVGQLYFTIEGNDSEVKDFSMSKRLGGEVIDDNAEILNLFASEGTSPVIKRAFILSSIENGDTHEYKISVEPDSGATLGGGAATGFLYHNAYAGQWFIDTDGSLQYGWEDGDGTVKYETALTDHDALIKA